MRLLAVEGCISIASLLAEEQRKELIKPVLINLIEDKSWRVRYMVAEKFTDVGSFVLIDNIWSFRKLVLESSCILDSSISVETHLLECLYIIDKFDISSRGDIQGAK